MHINKSDKIFIIHLSPIYTIVRRYANCYFIYNQTILIANNTEINDNWKD